MPGPPVKVDVSAEDGLPRLLACLMLRKGQAAIEKDEIVGFVDRNRIAIESGALGMERSGIPKNETFEILRDDLTTFSCRDVLDCNAATR